MAESWNLLQIIFFGFVALSWISFFVQGVELDCQVGSFAWETGQPIKDADTTVKPTVFIETRPTPSAISRVLDMNNLR